MIRNVFLAGVIGLSTLVAQAQTVKISTNQGDIVVQLDAAKAPKTVANFLAYVKSGHYSGTIFHRVIDGFMAQTGDPTGTGMGGSKYPNLKQEFNAEPHVRGNFKSYSFAAFAQHFLEDFINCDNRDEQFILLGDFFMENFAVRPGGKIFKPA